MKSFHGHGNTTQHNLPRESEQRFWPRPRQKATECSNPKRRAAFGKALPIDRRSLARLCQTTAGSLPGPAKRPSVIGKPPKSEKLKTIRKVRPVFAVTGKQPLHVNREIENKIVPMLKLIDRFWRRIERDRRSSFPNYYYILFKLLELTGQTDLLPQVSLLRTRLPFTSPRLHLEEGVRRAGLDLETK